MRTVSFLLDTRYLKEDIIVYVRTESEVNT